MTSCCWAGLQQSAAVDPDGVGAERLNRGQVVGDEKHGTAGGMQVAHGLQAFALKFRVSHCQDFVHDQDVRFEMRGHGKSQSHPHAAGIALDRVCR